MSNLNTAAPLSLRVKRSNPGFKRYKKNGISVIYFLGMIFTLSGCLSPVNRVPEKKYLLNTAAAPVRVYKKNQGTLLVLMPQTAPAYDTTQMAYSTKPYQIAYFAKNQWAETPSQMLQPLLVKTLENTHHFHAIVASPFIGRYRYILSTEILELKQDFTVNPPTLRLKMRAQLRSGLTNEVRATETLAVNEPLPQANPYGGVIAANRAFSVALEKIALFCAKR